MVTFNPTLRLIIIIGALQACTANPVSVEDENDATKLFSADELKRARIDGMSEQDLIAGTSLGYTPDEMIRMRMLMSRLSSNQSTFNDMTKICEILVQQHKTATNYTNAQDILVNELLDSNDKSEYFSAHFLRNSVCAYISDPFMHEMDARSFGLQLIPYMKFRFWKLKNQNAVGVERVTAAKQLCCIYNGRDNTSKFKVPSTSLSLSEKNMKEFTKHWNEFETSKTSKSFLEVCDFLRSTDTTDEC